MAHSKQAFKRARQSEQKRIVNKTVRTRMKSAIKGVLVANDGDRPAALREAMKKIDKAAKTHAIHANTASRYKSRVAKALNKAKAAAK
jgi:small subunit ribosomal protein S20